MKRGRGFTLIELILVMTVLIIAVALTTPQLSHLFRGRILGEEARRLLAVSRHARSQAVALALPMQLWIEPDSKSYGVEPDGGYAGEDVEPEVFTLNAAVSFDFAESELGSDFRVAMRFLPDGSVDESGVRSVTLVADNGKLVKLEFKGQTAGYVLGDTVYEEDMP